MIQISLHTEHYVLKLRLQLTIGIYNIIYQLLCLYPHLIALSCKIWIYIQNCLLEIRDVFQYSVLFTDVILLGDISEKRAVTIAHLCWCRQERWATRTTFFKHLLYCL